LIQKSICLLKRFGMCDIPDLSVYTLVEIRKEKWYLGRRV